jgi:hypothetical protein
VIGGIRLSPVLRVQLMIGALALVADLHLGAPAAASQRPAAAPVEAQTGVGGATPTRPGTIAQAEAQYAETARKCQSLSLAAVRDECLREARRTLDGEIARLKDEAKSGR